MKLNVRYQHFDWWYWLVIGLSIGVGLAGWREGFFYICAIVSGLNFLHFIIRNRSLISFPVQVREVWLLLVLISLWPPLWWMFISLFIGMVLVILFDRCGIVRALILMPWNKVVKLS